MGKLNRTFLGLATVKRTIAFVLVYLFSALLHSQTDVEKIVALNRTADSLTHIDIPESKRTAEKALELAIRIKNDTLEYASRFSKSIADYYLGNLNICLEDFLKNLQLAKKLNDTKKIIESLNAVGNVYKDNERYDLAIQSYKEALEVCEKTGNTSKSYLILSNVAIIYSMKHENDSSIAINNRILRNMQKLDKKDKHFESSLYGALMTCYIDKQNIDSIEKYAHIALQLKKEMGEMMNYAGYLFNLANFYGGIQNYKKAEEYTKLALETNPDNIELRYDLQELLGTAQFRLKDYEHAAQNFFDCLHLKDSLNKIQNIDALSEMEVKYETGKKEEELKRLSAEKEVDELKVKQSQIWLIFSGAGILLVVVVAGLLFRQNKSRQRANKLLQQQNNEIIHQKKEITDSINYAKRIQLAILPPDKMVKRLLPDAFVFYKPKDVVSGDFYWIEEKNGKVMFAAVDCTGHGVPGAMMSVVGLNLLNQAVKEKGLTVPADILQHLDTGVTDTLRQSTDNDSIKDGMDLSLCSYDPKTNVLQYAGAFNNLWIVRKNISTSHQLRSSHEVFFEEHLLEIKADKFPIGSNLDGVADTYTNHTFQLQKGDCVYLYSDGFADQFGGPKGKKFKYNALKKFLVSVHHLPPDEQKQKLLEIFENWRGNLEQIDDVLVLGICV